MITNLLVAILFIMVGILYLHIGKLKKQVGIWKIAAQSNFLDINGSDGLIIALEYLKNVFTKHINGTPGDVWVDMSINKTHILKDKHTHKNPEFRFLHAHPEMEKTKSIDKTHVIVDRADWETVIKTLRK